MKKFLSIILLVILFPVPIFAESQNVNTNGFPGILITILFVLTSLIVFAVELVSLLSIRGKTNSNEYTTIEKQYSGNLSNDKSYEKAAEFFNIDTLYETNGINISHIKATPSTIVGIGILGTFVGLCIVLMSGPNGNQGLFNIQAMLEGMKPAFITSAVGMSLSLVFGWIMRSHLKNLSIKLSSICEEKDRIHFINQSSLISDIGKSICSSFSEEISKSVSSTVNKITLNLARQVQYAGTTIENSAVHLERTVKEMTKLERLITDINEACETLSNICKTINECQHEFQSTISEFGDAAIQVQNAGKELGDSTNCMKESLDNFSSIGETISGLLPALEVSAKNNVETEKIIKELTINLGNHQTALNQFRDSLKTVSNLGPDINKAFEEIDKSIITHVELLQSQTRTLLSEYTNEFTKACCKIDGTSNNLNGSANHISMSITKMNESISELQKTVNSFAESFSSAIHYQTSDK